MINIDAIRHLYAYNRWATERLLSAADDLPPEQWARDLHSSFPSLRHTFAHMLGAEWLWLKRWQGESPRAVPDWAHEPSQFQLRVALLAVENERSQFIDSLTGADLESVVHYRRLNGEENAQPLGDLMMHVVNHSTYHRGQAVTLFRQLGVAPPSTDLLLYNIERPTLPT